MTFWLFSFPYWPNKAFTYLKKSPIMQKRPLWWNVAVNFHFQEKSYKWCQISGKSTCRKLVELFILWKSADCEFLGSELQVTISFLLIVELVKNHKWICAVLLPTGICALVNCSIVVLLLRVAFQDSIHCSRVSHLLIAVPVDGKWSDWEPKLVCNPGQYSHYKYFTRKCTNPAPRGGGLPCPGKSTGKAFCALRIRNNHFAMVSSGIYPAWLHALRRNDWPAIASLQG